MNARFKDDPECEWCFDCDECMNLVAESQYLYEEEIKRDEEEIKLSKVLDK